MSQYFLCGFEENDLTLTSFTTLAGTCPIVTSSPTPHSGTYCLTTNNAAGSNSVTAPVFPTSLTSGTVYTRFYWSTTAVTFATNTQIMAWLNSSLSNSVLITQLTTGAIRLTNSVSGTTADSGTGILTINTWYRFELDHTLLDSGGTITLRMYAGDSLTQITGFPLTITGEDTLATNLNSLRLGKGGTSSVVTYAYDDVAVNYGDGIGVQVITPGPGKTALMTPNADTAVAWTKAGSVPAATNFGGVDDVPGTPNEGTDYNKDSGTTNVDQFGLTALPAEVTADANILVAIVRARVAGAAASQTLVTRLWDESSNITASPSISLSSGGSWVLTTTVQNAMLECTGKSTANLNAFSIGYKGNTGSGEKRVGAIWMNVGWIEGAGLMGAQLT